MLAVNRNEPLIAELLGDYFTPVHAPLSQPVIRKPPNDNAGAFEILVQLVRKSGCHIRQGRLICSAVLKL